MFWAFPAKWNFEERAFSPSWNSSSRHFRFAEGRQSLCLADLLKCWELLGGCCSVSWRTQAGVPPPVPLRRVLRAHRGWRGLFGGQLSFTVSSLNCHCYSLTCILFRAGCYVLINVYVTLMFIWIALIYLLLGAQNVSLLCLVTCAFSPFIRARCQGTFSAF